MRTRTASDDADDDMGAMIPWRPRRRRALLATAAAALMLARAPSPSRAADEAPRRLRYRIEVAGVEVGGIDLSTRDDGADGVWARVGWELGGLMGLVARSRGRLEGSGRRAGGGDGGGEVVPTSFAGSSKKSDRRRDVRIAYGADGAISTLSLTRNGKPRESEVPGDLRSGTVDTLTAFWRLRRWADRGPAAAPATVPVFDGQRRYDLVARAVGDERVRLGGREVDAERIELRLVPRAGFDAGDKVFGSRVDPDRPWAEILVGRDTEGGEAIPISAAGEGRAAWRITLRDD